jgi:glycosyltransferase involved in cell wall biosynthesis
MKLTVALIHQEKKLRTGAHFINELMSQELQKRGVRIRHFYPRTTLVDAPRHLKGLNNILFFHSLLEHRKEILKCDLVQGTTYTPLALLTFGIPVVSHFGSTTDGFLKAVPQTYDLSLAQRKLWAELRRDGVIDTLNIPTRRPLRDIAEIEHYVASQASAVIATSELVARELRAAGVPGNRIHVIHNAIEDFWFEKPPVPAKRPSLVYLGRLGDDPFTLKLKGFDRLVACWRSFPSVPKRTFCISTNEALTEWMSREIPVHDVQANVLKDRVCAELGRECGSILLMPSRYEGFGLSLVEGMSQGLIPITTPVGVAPEIIQDGKNGYLVRDEKAMIAVARKLLSDARLRARLSVGALRTAHAFRASTLADRLIGTYKDVLKRA